MKSKGFEYRFRPALSAPADRHAPPPHYRRTVESGMIVERNVAIPLRDGIEIYADVMRPVDETPAAPLIAWTVYGKHQDGRHIFSVNPKAGVSPGQISPYTTFEGPDPMYWVPRGYAVLNVDIRGTWYSQGDATFVSPEEAEDFYDVIEWAGTQAWSNGKVGLTGVSYLAVSQWRVAELNPPHLAAINPWEGWTDTYRELVRHGGIPDSWFWTIRLIDSWGTSTNRIEDLLTETLEHPFYDAFWESKTAELSRITVPAYIVACWADQGLHLRGTLEGFKLISSQDKWLTVHGRKKWAYYYDPESVKRLQEFFDFYLRGITWPLEEWPRVRLEVRDRFFVGSMRHENEWPIARTRYTRLYLDAGMGILQTAPVSSESVCSYDALGGGPGPHRAIFEHTFERATELIGHMKLRLFMAAEEADDMDIFVGVYKFDRDGVFVPMSYYSFFEDGPVALGWLRASHRELDAERSTAFQPYHSHRRKIKLEAGAVAALDIEIWPSGTRFEAGEKLQLIVQGTDLQKYSKIVDPIYTRHEDTVNSGRHHIYTGGRYDSYLLIPVIPPS